MNDEKQGILEPSLWVKRYADMMLNFAFRRTNDLTLSEDLVQDTFFAALKSKDNFKGKSQEKTWLYSILENKITDYFRSSNYTFQKHKVAIGNEFFGHFFETEKEGGHWHEAQKPKAWQSSTIENVTESEEFDVALQNCLKKLPQKLERIFALKHIEDLDAPKICKELDITPSNYWVMMHRAKVQLRACLETNWFTL
jgi:RNA polymerase sigma-70 factor (TIGR02943 family)